MKTNKSCFLLCREDDARHPGLHAGEDMSMVAARSIFYEIVRNKDFNFSSGSSTAFWSLLPVNKLQ
jgi:hypothetical protein